jgi:hypothetical protein
MLRFTLPPGTGDVPPITAARRLGLTLDAFLEKLPQLLEHGFPPADPITGNYDLDAIDRWRRRRHPLLFGDQLTPPPAPAARDAKDVVAERLARLRNG